MFKPGDRIVFGKRRGVLVRRGTCTDPDEVPEILDWCHSEEHDRPMPTWDILFDGIEGVRRGQCEYRMQLESDV